MTEKTSTNIIITMAGEGSRFFKAGYEEPKFKIILGNQSLFYWSVISLKSYIDKNSKFIFIAQKKHHAKDFIMQEITKLGINNYDIIELENPTQGQAETVLHAKNIIDSSLPILIYNIDTYVNPNQIPYYQYQGVDGVIPCFEAHDNKWSFVKVDSDLNVIEVREKEVISNHATIGLYGFSSFDLYEEIYNKYYSDSKNIEKNELYIAPMYNQLISDGKKVKISLIDKEKILNLGTPEDLEVAKNILIKFRNVYGL